MKKISFCLPVITVFLMTSCATVFTGTSDNITVNTKPEGAKVFVKGLEKCTTPCTFKMPRSLSDQTFEIKKDGYEQKTIGLDREFNSVSIINLIDVIGWGVDAATGSLMKYGTKGYTIELDKK